MDMPVFGHTMKIHLVRHKNVVSNLLTLINFYRL
jgi:hypothetical protein